MSDFYQDFTEFEFPRFIQGPYLRTTLSMLPYHSKERVLIMVPYLIKSLILDSIIGIPDYIEVKVYTRDRKGYLPNIKSGAQPALNQLTQKNNIQVFVDNRIHAKIWVIDRKFAIIHSMNGTFHSENVNFEAGVVSIEKKLIDEVISYFQFVEAEAKRIS